MLRMSRYFVGYFVGFFVTIVLTLFSAEASAMGANSLRLGSLVLNGYESGFLEFRVTNTEPLLGLGAVFAFDNSSLIVAGLELEFEADYLSVDIDASSGTLTVLVQVDTDSVGPFSLPASADLLIAQVEIAPALFVSVEENIAFGFDSSPLNQLVFASGGWGVAEGLGLVAGVVTLLPGPANVIRIEDTSIASQESRAARVLLDNPQASLQGYSLAISHDAVLLELESIHLAGTISSAVGAEFVFIEMDFGATSGGSLVVILDFYSPFSAQKILPGMGQHIANFVYRALPELLLGESPIQTSLTPVNGILGTPPGSNLLIVNDDLTASPELESASVSITPADQAAESIVRFYVGYGALDLDDLGAPIAGDSVLAQRGGATQICFYYTSEVNLQGFQLALCFDCELQVSNFRVDNTIVEDLNAEFVNFQVDQDPYDGDGCELIVGVLLDALPPFTGQTLPPTDTPLAIGCVDVTVVSEPVCEPLATDLSNGIAFYAGPAGGLVLDASGVPTGGPIEADPGELLDICFYYTSLFYELQGLQLAISYDCDLVFGNFSIDGSVPELVGAEFVSFSVDNDPSDGDGCELVVGILLDTLPFFEGQTLPLSSEPLLIGCIDVAVSPLALCESLLKIEFRDWINGAGNVDIENIAVVDFESIQQLSRFCTAILVKGDGPCKCLSFEYCDGINGTGAVSIENIAVFDYQSIQMIDKYPGSICLTSEELFLRGDCNQDGKFDIADGASVLGFHFQGLQIDCRDACDINDDGGIDLADLVFTLNYLYQPGASYPPPSPGPGCGIDPTDDALECESYTECAPE